MNSPVLENLYQDNNFEEMEPAQRNLTLEKLYKRYILSILNDNAYLDMLKNNHPLIRELRILKSILVCAFIYDESKIKTIKAKEYNSKVDGIHRINTNILVQVVNFDGSVKSIKVSSNISMSKYICLGTSNLETLLNALGIKDSAFIELLNEYLNLNVCNKDDKEKKKQLANRIAPVISPVSDKLKKWLTFGDDNISENINIPDVIVSFQLCDIKFEQKNQTRVFKHVYCEYIDSTIYNIQDFIKSLGYTKEGKMRDYSFSTGLLWKTLPDSRIAFELRSKV